MFEVHVTCFINFLLRLGCLNNYLYFIYMSIKVNKNKLQKYCDDYEKIENYDVAISADELYEVHHRLEVADGHEIHSKSELIAMNLYYHRPPEELIFLSRSEHRKLHNSTVESRLKTSKACKGVKKHSGFGDKLREYYKTHKRYNYNENPSPALIRRRERNKLRAAQRLLNSSPMD